METSAIEIQKLNEANLGFKDYFLNNSDESIAANRQLVMEVYASITELITKGKPLEQFKAAIAENELLPESGNSINDILNKTKELINDWYLGAYRRSNQGQLQSPVFVASLVAEMIITTFNQSMESLDWASASYKIEQDVCSKLWSLFGFGPGCEVTFTGSETISNFMGLLLARDKYCLKHFKWNIQKNGLPPETSKLRILVSEHSNFNITPSSSILGLGQKAIVKIKDVGVNEEVIGLENVIIKLLEEGLYPIAYITTAGSSDGESIGEIGELADCVHFHGMWLHVDASYGGALIFSDQHGYKLEGIGKADSLTVDLNKLFNQPISSRFFILRDKYSFNPYEVQTYDINSGNTEPDLVYKSFNKSGRFEALKPYIAFRHIGVKKFGEMIDYTIALAIAVSGIIENDPEMELAFKPPINTVVFRYVPLGKLNPIDIDAINNNIRYKYLPGSKAIIGETTFKQRSFLKIILGNPMTTLGDVKQMLHEIKKMGKSIEKQYLNKFENELV